MGYVRIYPGEMAKYRIEKGCLTCISGSGVWVKIRIVPPDLFFSEIDKQSLIVMIKAHY